ncbi:MAG TPA: DMT family transporter, partial [Cellvibrionaceae bacterium]|nr:DMT family transporter [Cellvibrionaceae bacterium]
IIWATTPLGIKWSNSGLSFSSAITLRMLLALILCAAVLAVQKKRLIHSKKDWQAFGAGALGLFPNMLIVYWSAQYIPSGLVSILLGFFPFFLGVFSWLLLRERSLNARQVAALCLAFCGLAVIYMQQVQTSWQALWAVLGVLVAAAFWALSSIWVKALGVEIDAMRQSTGTLLIAAPIFAVYWLLFDHQLPAHWQLKSQLGVVYLVVAGSCLGHTLYFYVLRRCSLAATGLLTLLSPMVALGIGFLVLGETLSVRELIGVALVLMALGVYSGVLIGAWNLILLKLVRMGRWAAIKVTQ